MFTEVLTDDYTDIPTLVAAAAHEIKNPVALALANVSLIRLTDETGALNGYCAMIERALMHINELVLELIEAVGETPDITEFNIIELLEDILAENRFAWPAIQFIFRKPLKPLLFTGEKKKIQMVFNNLLKNAVEAVGSTGFIEVALEADRRIMQITIRDSGKGIDENTRAHIASGRYTSKPNGSGLGLIICQSLIKRCGGQFLMQNSSLGGCEAVVTLPMCS